MHEKYQVRRRPAASSFYIAAARPEPRATSLPRLARLAQGFVRLPGRLLAVLRTMFGRAASTAHQQRPIGYLTTLRAAAQGLQGFRGGGHDAALARPRLRCPQQWPVGLSVLLEYDSNTISHKSNRTLIMYLENKLQRWRRSRYTGKEAPGSRAPSLTSPSFATCARSAASAAKSSPAPSEPKTSSLRRATAGSATLRPRAGGGCAAGKAPTVAGPYILTCIPISGAQNQRE